MCHTLHMLIEAVAKPWATAETQGANDFLLLWNNFGFQAL